jgi:hypothetical protein
MSVISGNDTTALRLDSKPAGPQGSREARQPWAEGRNRVAVDPLSMRPEELEQLNSSVLAAPADENR